MEKGSGKSVEERVETCLSVTGGLSLKALACAARCWQAGFEPDRGLICPMTGLRN